jgi:hypothetical protein
MIDHDDRSLVPHCVCAGHAWKRNADQSQREERKEQCGATDVGRKPLLQSR